MVDGQRIKIKPSGRDVRLRRQAGQRLDCPMAEHDRVEHGQVREFTDILQMIEHHIRERDQGEGRNKNESRSSVHQAPEV